MAVLAIWTGGVLFYTGFRRIKAVMARQVPPRAFRLGESPEVPDDIRVANRNLMNLLEMPVLFYVVALALYATKLVNDTAIVLAWMFVAMRLVHSLIHLTSNRVVRRLIPFALSNVVLLAMWIQFVARLP